MKEGKEKKEMEKSRKAENERRGGEEKGNGCDAKSNGRIGDRIRGAKETKVAHKNGPVV